MASVKRLKKDIDLLMSLVLNDCFYVLEQNSKVNEEAIILIATEVIQKHRSLRLKAIHPDGKDNPKLVKKYYKNIIAELLSSTDEFFEKLSAEIKKVAN